MCSNVVPDGPALFCFREMVGGVPAACLATQSGSGREEDGWREQKASSVSSELRPTRHQGGLQGGLPIVGACYRCLPHSGAALQVSGVQLLHCICLDCPERAGFGLCAACYSYPPVLPRPGLPHSGGVLQLSCLPRVSGL
ncbi:unnamed protein product [Closterium sp. NIES-64]|nr:unnamed protein product [Closterium sp. NIES-64]